MMSSSSRRITSASSCSRVRALASNEAGCAVIADARSLKARAAVAGHDVDRTQVMAAHHAAPIRLMRGGVFMGGSFRHFPKSARVTCIANNSARFSL